MILAGDIGGTKVRLALAEPVDGRARLAYVREYPSGSGPSFEAVIERFLSDANRARGGAASIRAACLGVAGPVVGGRVRFTNVDWDLDAAGLTRVLPRAVVSLVNDFVAAAAGIDAMGPADAVRLQDGEAQADAPRLVIGAGTGLGVAHAVSDGGRYRILPGEGGHAAFAPADATQAALWRWLHERYGRVEQEHVVSGPGLARVYEFMARAPAAGPQGGVSADAPLQAPEAIVAQALSGRDATALAALDLFIRCYGAVAGDHALALLPRGGVFIAGGVAIGILPRMVEGGFMAAFNDKGAFSGLVRSLPVTVIVQPQLGLLGAALLAMRA